VYDDDDDDDAELSSGSGHGDDDVTSPNHHYHVIPHDDPPAPPFNPHGLPTHRPPVMYTAASVAGPVIYTTPGHVYVTFHRTSVSHVTSPSLILLLVIVSVSGSVTVDAVS